MKKILSLVVVLIAIGQVNANEIEPKSPVGVSVIKSGSIVKLFYQGDHTGNVKVKIYNERGRTLFVETIHNMENFMRPYNFSTLPEGQYTIELTDDQGTHFKKVSHSNSQSNQKRAARLTRLGDGNRYMLAVPNVGKDVLTVSIYDGGSRLLYTETLPIDGDFAKVYNLNKISGGHTFEIVDQDRNTNRLSKPMQ